MSEAASRYSASNRAVVGSEVESSMTDPTPTLRSRGRSITPGYAAQVRLLPAAVLVLAVAGASTAVAAGAPTVDRNPRLWSTINICDTVKHPDVIGIRASMPGSGKRKERMYMRFQVQYFRQSSQKWVFLGASADSGFRSVGSAKYVRRESGWNFSIMPPPEGQTFRLRGVVNYE